MSANSSTWTFVFIAILALGVSGARNRNKRPQQEPVEVDDSAEISDQCPEPDGYFADAEQCDKYYHCSNGRITEKLCPDGQVFNDYSSEYEKCDLPFNIDCSSRPKLQEPQPSEHCPRKHGYFAHDQKNICDKFYFCVDGKFNAITCPNGLVYNVKAGICSWPDEAKRSGCTSEEVFEFQCPKVTEDVAITHPRYPDPEDCQYFYVCINGNSPRRNGCKLGQVFDDVTKRCDWARNVPECADWYQGRLTEQQLKDLENPPTARPKATKGSKRKGQRPRERTVVHDDE
ncbi:protein obstructor-E-like [Diabrotica virgifera virgifera]|uniref:Protein obstructor-E-like n=1 Tax=Diabrotica virgifera virgifera TaxID=50390 RepID=A0A6P7G144_DIAVI|nr:protein obstructor-E-like [Diabrotica virgifera virgifera]